MSRCLSCLLRLCSPCGVLPHNVRDLIAQAIGEIGAGVVAAKQREVNSLDCESVERICRFDASIGRGFSLGIRPFFSAPCAAMTALRRGAKQGARDRLATVIKSASRDGFAKSIGGAVNDRRIDAFVEAKVKILLMLRG